MLILCVYVSVRCRNDILESDNANINVSYRTMVDTKKLEFIERIKRVNILYQ